MTDNPAHLAAKHACETYHQRRIDIADNYSRQCDANSDRLVKELAEIACRYDLAPTRVVTYAFSSARPDFIRRVRQAVSVLKVRQDVPRD